MDGTPRCWFAAIACLVVACNLPQPLPSTSPAPSNAASTPSPAPSTSTTRRFEAPGISFDYPIAWDDQTAVVGEYPILGRRHVATFTRGMTACPYEETRLGAPGCANDPDKPGQLRVDIIEYLDLYPSQRAAETTLVDRAPPIRSWVVPAADGGYYRARLVASSHEADETWSQIQTEFDALVESIDVRRWSIPPSSLNGLIKQSSPYGFSFDYPADWARYFPLSDRRDSRADTMFVTIASRPVSDPSMFTADALQPFLTPPGAAVMEFKVERGARLIDWDYVWKHAENEVNGQPATVNVKPIENTDRVGADQLVTWRIRRPFDIAYPLTIHLWLRGPSIDAARAEAEAVIDSLVMEIPAT